jgi:hypothetical protein
LVKTGDLLTALQHRERFCSRLKTKGPSKLLNYSLFRNVKTFVCYACEPTGLSRSIKRLRWGCQYGPLPLLNGARDLPPETILGTAFGLLSLLFTSSYFTEPS